MFGQIVDFLAIRVSIRITDFHSFNASFAHIPIRKKQSVQPPEKNPLGFPTET